VLKDLPQVNPAAKDCVRFDPRARRYELVVGGEVKASISSFGMTVPGTRRKFDAAVKAALRERQIDATVERLYPEPLRGADALRAEATEK
jgi:hypothetical protein